MNPYKKWNLTFFSLFALLMLVVITFNYYTDNLGFFYKQRYFENAAIQLSQGHNIAGLKNYDERLFQKFIIENQPEDPDVILIGSSRTLQIRKPFLNTNKTFFNHSVSGASIEDLIGIIGMYKKHSDIPEEIIIGVDPWIFNKNNDQNRWESIQDYYYFFNNCIGCKNDQVNMFKNIFQNNKYLQLINYSYTVNNINSLLNKEGNLFATETTDIDDFIKSKDGSLYYPFDIRKQAEEETNKKAKEYIQNKIYSLEDFDKLSNKDAFESLVSYLKNNDKKITFVLMPYHPLVYRKLTNDHKYKLVNIVENYIKDFAKNHNIEVIGSYDPENGNYKDRDFFDGMHGTESLTKKMMQCYPTNLAS